MNYWWLVLPFGFEKTTFTFLSYLTSISFQTGHILKYGSESLLRWACVFVWWEPSHWGVRAQIWSRVVLCSPVRQQPLTPLYHLTGRCTVHTSLHCTHHTHTQTWGLTYQNVLQASVSLLYSWFKECEKSLNCAIAPSFWSITVELKTICNFHFLNKLLREPFA